VLRLLTVERKKKKSIEKLKIGENDDFGERFLGRQSIATTGFAENHRLHTES
jgi:hypothetical protein